MSIIHVKAGLMLQQLKRAEAGMPPAANDVVDMDSTRGLLADFVPATWGGERAGRSQALAQASGTTPNFDVRHPVTATAGRTIAGGLLGGLGGAALGGAIGYGLDKPIMGEEPTLAGAGIGAASGLAIGGGLGYTSAALARRDEMGSINNHYDAVREEGGLDPQVPKFNLAATLLAPGRGPHRTGQLDGYEAVANGKSVSSQRPHGRDIAYAFGHTGTPGGAAVGGLHQIYQNIMSHRRAGQLNKKNRKEQPKEDKSGKPDKSEETVSKAAEAYYSPANHCNAFTAAIRQHAQQKQAEMPNWQQMTSDPMASSLGGAAVGGLVGAGLGGASEMMREKKDRNMLRGLLGGGALGAGVGGAAGYAANRWTNPPADRPEVTGDSGELGTPPPIPYNASPDVPEAAASPASLGVLQQPSAKADLVGDVESPGMSAVSRPWLSGSQGPMDSLRAQAQQGMPDPLIGKLGRPDTAASSVPSGGNPNPLQGFNNPEAVANMRHQDIQTAMKRRDYENLTSPRGNLNPVDQMDPFGDNLLARRKAVATTW